MPFTQRSEQPRLGRGHHWTKFELDIVLGLICKGEHLKCPPLIFATKLNEALNGKGNRVDYDADIPVDDVRDLLADIEAQKKGALAFIERQPRPHVMTRTKKRAFERNLPFTGSKEEWVTGRRDQVAAMKETGKLKKDGLESSFINTHGVQIERWVPRTVIQPGRTDTWMAGDSYTHHQTEQRVPFGVVSHGYSGGQTRSGNSFLTPMLPSATHFDGGWACTPMLPPMTPVLDYGWAALQPLASTPNMHHNGNTNTPWHADSFQAKIGAITSDLQQQFPNIAPQQPCGSLWSPKNMACDAAGKKENQPPWGCQEPTSSK